MRKLALLVLTFASLAVVFFASPSVKPSGADLQAERSGCCSHHGGVCGCSAGRAVCCDGALSPSCGCD